MESHVDTLMNDAISIMGRSENVFGISINMMRQLPPEPSHQGAFEDLVMNIILDQEEKGKQLEEYMGAIGSDFIQLSLEVIGKLKEEIRMEENRTKNIKKIIRYPNTEDLEPLNGHKFSEALTEKASFHTPKFISPKLLFLPSFEEYTSLVTYPKEIEETLGILMEVERLDEPQLEDLGLNTCNHEIPLSSMEIYCVDEPEPQLLPFSSPLDVILGDKRGTDPPINPCSPGSFRKKVVDPLSIHTPPYYQPSLGDPKKLYRFKSGLLGHSGYLGVDFLKSEVIEDDWELESKEVSFLRRGFNSLVRPKEVKKNIDIGKKAYLLEEKQVPSVGIFDEVFLVPGWHLEEINVTWAHLEKKQTRLRLYTKYLEELHIQSVEMVSRGHVGGLEDDEERLLDELHELETSFDVLDTPCDAAA
ncbi:hypothetical protein Tco_0332217 [Tanacetum coccineum]